jgi:hypothetical protein
MELIEPKDALEIVTVKLNPGRLTRYGRLLRDLQLAPDGITPAARFAMGLEAAGKSDYLENKDLDHNLGDGAFTSPATVALALCTSVPTDASTGATIVEATYTGYARKVVEAAALSAAASGSKTNSSALEFAACTAGSSTIIGWALLDSSATGAGNALYWGTCTSTVISTTQTPATVAIGGLVVTED